MLPCNSVDSSAEEKGDWDVQVINTDSWAKAWWRNCSGGSLGTGRLEITSFSVDSESSPCDRDRCAGLLTWLPLMAMTVTVTTNACLPLQFYPIHVTYHISSSTCNLCGEAASYWVFLRGSWLHFYRYLNRITGAWRNTKVTTVATVPIHLLQHRNLMEPRETLPLDILLYIIDLLACGDDGNIASLQTLSLACKFMVPLCRKHLFSSLRLRESNSKRLSDLLSKNPDIARYVKSLIYNVYKTISDHELNVLDILKERSSLKSISLVSEPGFNWNNLPESIRSSLVSLVQLPTVTFLNIHSFRGFPATGLSGCGNLIDLQFGELEFAPEVYQVISRSKIPTPASLFIRNKTYGLATLFRSASPHSGGPIVDLSRLQKAVFNVESRGDIVQVNELIKLMTQLEYLNIITCISGEWLVLSLIHQKFWQRICLVNQPVELAGLGANLAINVYRTLKILALSITVVGDDHDPLCGLSRELRCIAGNNILEELELDVVVCGACRTESEDWSTFDSVLTKSGAFPILRLVWVEICWNSQAGTLRDLDNEVGMLRSFKEVKFPRLVESKAVEFYLSTQFECHNTALQNWIGNSFPPPELNTMFCNPFYWSKSNHYIQSYVVRLFVWCIPVIVTMPSTKIILSESWPQQLTVSLAGTVSNTINIWLDERTPCSCIPAIGIWYVWRHYSQISQIVRHLNNGEPRQPQPSEW